MPEIRFAEGVESRPRALAGAMLDALRRYWTDAESYQKFLYSVGALLVASAVFHLVVLIVTGGSWYGTVSWRKPILFGESFGLTALSVAWVLTFLPKRKVAGWLLAGAIGLANTGEVTWVSMQQWRGVPSHFNFSTAFDAAAFSVGGAGLIAITGLVILAVTLWSFFSLVAPPSIKVAIQVGMVLLLLAQVFGFVIIQHGVPLVVNQQTGEFISKGLESAAIFGEAGVMKLPHALALHAAQVLPVLAFLLLFTPWEESRRTLAVMLGAAGYVGLVAVGTFQTFSGRAPIDLGLSPALVLALSGALVVAVYAATLFALRPTVTPRGEG